MKAHVEAFHRDGFLLLKKFFDPHLMSLLNRQIVAHFGDNPAFEHSPEFLATAKTDVIPWFPQDEGPCEFDQIDDCPALQQITRALLGEHWQRLQCMVMYSKQGSVGQAWHQDCAPEKPSRYNLNRLIYSADIHEEGGGQTVVVPGSHRRGLLPAGDPWATLDGQLVLSPGQGDLLLLHGHVWHRVLPVHGRHRYSTNYRAAPAGTAVDVTDVCVYRNMRYQFSTATVVEVRGA